MLSKLFSSNTNEKATFKAYNVAVREYSDRVCLFAERLLRDTGFAKDITQEAFIKLWNHRDNVQFNNARGWLFTTTYRLCMDHLRKKNLLVLGEVQVSEPYCSQSNEDMKEMISLALEQLSEVQKSILMLRDYEGYDYREIGEILELNESQVKVYLFRARKKMREFIGNPELILGQ